MYRTNFFLFLLQTQMTISYRTGSDTANIFYQPRLEILYLQEIVLDLCVLKAKHSSSKTYFGINSKWHFRSYFEAFKANIHTCAAHWIFDRSIRKISKSTYVVLSYISDLLRPLFCTICTTNMNDTSNHVVCWWDAITFLSEWF